MKNILVFTAGAALSALSLQALAGEAHEHGVADLQVAIEKHSVEVVLNSPADNIVGFESFHGTAEQKDRLKAAEKTLRDVSQVLYLPPAAKCKLESAVIEHPFHVEDAQDSDHSHEEHADFSAHYHFHCDNIAAVKAFELPLLKAFPAIHTLRYQWVADQKQAAGHLDHGDDTFYID